MRSGQNQVRVKVRYHALLLQAFTVEEIIRATGLKESSIRTELQRMLQEGLLLSGPRERSSEKGILSVRYAIPDTLDVRRQLAKSVQAFFMPSTPDPVADTIGKVESTYYYEAKQLLDELPPIPTAMDDTDIHIRIERLLERAEQAEGFLSASQSVATYIGVQRSRLAFLRRQYQEAFDSLILLRPFFVRTANTQMVSVIDDMLERIERERLFAHLSKEAALPVVLQPLGGSWRVSQDEQYGADRLWHTDTLHEDKKQSIFDREWLVCAQTEIDGAGDKHEKRRRATDIAADYRQRFPVSESVIFEVVSDAISSRPFALAEEERVKVIGRLPAAYMEGVINYSTHIPILDTFRLDSHIHECVDEKMRLSFEEELFFKPRRR